MRLTLYLVGAEVFETGGHTIGIWIHLKQLEDGSSMLVLDSEGLVGKNLNHHKLLTFIVLLTSDGGVLINNGMNDIGPATLEVLEMLMTIKEKLKGMEENSWPALVILLRDFNTRVVDAMQYLNYMLKPSGDCFDSVRQVSTLFSILQTVINISPTVDEG